MSDFEKTHRYNTEFTKIHVHINRCTYDATFTAMYEWETNACTPFWDCIGIDGLVLKCMNGEDVYDCFPSKVRRYVDEVCYQHSIHNTPPDPS